MSNDVVRYNNGFNTVPLRNFTPVEMDIFWAICSKMKRKGNDTVEFKFEIFKELSNYERSSMNSFYLALKNVGDKLGTLTYKFEDESYYEQLWLFQRFAIDKENEKVIIQANERFDFILNSIGSNFTRFELENMTKLSSGYTKEIYRQLMAHRDIKTRKGAWYIKIDDFRDALAIPKSYRMSDIDKRILSVAEKEFLSIHNAGDPIFSSFRIEKVKARKGNKISSLRFYFTEFQSLIIPMLESDGNF